MFLQHFNPFFNYKKDIIDSFKGLIFILGTLPIYYNWYIKYINTNLDFI